MAIDGTRCSSLSFSMCLRAFICEHYAHTHKQSYTLLFSQSYYLACHLTRRYARDTNNYCCNINSMQYEVDECPTR